MSLAFKTNISLGLIAAIGLGVATPALAQQVQPQDAGLASAALANGNAFEAIELLRVELEKAPHDPALHINLGIAHAQTGNALEAKKHFEAAMGSKEVIDLDTADGRTMDSRKLARQAIAMLERGEFRPSLRQGERLTLRDQ